MKTSKPFGILAWSFSLAVFVSASTPKYERTDHVSDSGRRNVTEVDTRDQEASSGKSLRMAPEKGVTAPVADAYCYPPYPGKYRFTWRLKIDDNLGDATVVVVTPSFPGVKNPSLAIKPCDFERPKAYQEFCVEGVVPENVFGVYATDFYCNANHSVWWDSTKYELIEYYDDQRVIEDFYPDFPGFQDLKRTTGGEKLRTHVAYGVHYEASGLREALTRLGRKAPQNPPLPSDIRFYKPPGERKTGEWRETAFIDHGQVQDRTPGFPDNPSDFANLDLIVLANVPGRAVKATRRLLLQEWVKTASGGLLMTGGMTAFGKGFMEGSVLEEMLPVETSGVNDTKIAKEGRLVVKNDKVLADLLGDAPLATKFYHQTTVKPGATVLIETRDGIPLLVMGAYGKGRVAVWTAMALGSVPEGQVAWWKSDQWPAVLAEVIRRIAGQ